MLANTSIELKKENVIKIHFKLIMNTLKLDQKFTQNVLKAHSRCFKNQSKCFKNTLKMY